MKTIDHLNRRIMLAASIWAIALDLVHKVLAIPPPLSQFISPVLAFLSILLYPLLLSLIMKQRTSLWINPLMFSMIGSMPSLAVLALVESLLGQQWPDAGLFALAVWLFLYVLVPRTSAIPALEKERQNLSLRDELNSLSWLNFALFQIPFLLDDAR